MSIAEPDARSTHKFSGGLASSNNLGIQAIDYYVPEQVLSNEELAQRVDTTDEWIVSHTGIHQRHIAAEGQTTSDLAFHAANKVLTKVGLPGSEVDILIVATATPDYNGFPSTACVVQERLGCIGAPAFDIGAACSGFVYALETGRSMMLANPSYRNTLIIGAETFSKIINWQDRSTCVLFGDGAGAVLLAREEGTCQILDTVLHADGRGAYKLWIPVGGSRTPFEIAQAKQDMRNKIEMDGRSVYNFAVTANQKVLNQLLERNHLKVDDLRYIVPHQANERIILAVAKREKIPIEKFFINIGRYANTSAASIPIALSEMQQKGLLQNGDLLLTVGFGAGLTFGGSLLRWNSKEKNS